METVGELHIDDADLAQQPLFNHLPSLQNQLMPGVSTMPQRKERPTGLIPLIICFLPIKTQRIAGSAGFP